MATIREYYEKDFADCIKIHVSIPIKNDKIEANILYDFSGMNAFTCCYFEAGKSLEYFLNFISSYNKNPIEFDKQITLPAVGNYPGSLKVENIPDSEFEVLSKFYGESDWISTKNISSSGRIFFYSESDLTVEEISTIKKAGKQFGFDVQFRGESFTRERNSNQIPLAFISHDSKDKNAVARRIATNLQSKLCPVWYDEFSLSVGDNLRTSIEKGIKECSKCVLVLSTNFFSNSGWGKTEFESIFTRQILEKKNYILPVWYNISSQQVYEYSPSLLNTFGLSWDELGENEVCAKLYNAIIKP